MALTESEKALVFACEVYQKRIEKLEIALQNFVAACDSEKVILAEEYEIAKKLLNE